MAAGFEDLFPTVNCASSSGGDDIDGLAGNSKFDPPLSFGSPERPPPNSNWPTVVDISCGTERALFYVKLFRCPGTQALCVEHNGQMIGPKTFTILAGRAQRKNWKDSIRCGACTVKLQWMDYGQLDFYNHHEFCSRRCRPLALRTAPPTEPLVQPKPPLIFYPPAAAPSLPLSADPSSIFGPASSATSNFSSPPPQFHVGFTETDQSTVNNAMGLKQVLRQDPVKFWQLAAKMGLLKEFIAEIIRKIDEIHVEFVENPQHRQKLADQLSSLSVILETSAVMGYVVRQHYAVHLDSARQLHEKQQDLRQELASLEEEQNKRQHFSAMFTSLCDATQSAGGELSNL